MSSATKTYVGVDVSKARLDVAILPTGESFVVSNDEEGFDELLGRLREEEEEEPVTLVVLEASGGFERPLTAALAAEKMAVAVVNPRQSRDFARATGKLAKTDRLDAHVLARFAQAVQPLPRALPDEEAQEFRAILARRGQIISMMSAEKNRLGATASKAVAGRIQAHLRWLEKELARSSTEADLVDEAIENNPTFKENEALLRSVPGVGRVLCRTLLAELPELGSLARREISALVGVALPSTATREPSERPSRHLRWQREGQRSPLHGGSGWQPSQPEHQALLRKARCSR